MDSPQPICQSVTFSTDARAAREISSIGRKDACRSVSGPNPEPEELLMTHRVTFLEHTGAAGEPSEFPRDYCGDRRAGGRGLGPFCKARCTGCAALRRNIGRKRQRSLDYEIADEGQRNSWQRSKIRRWRWNACRSTRERDTESFQRSVIVCREQNERVYLSRERRLHIAQQEHPPLIQEKHPLTRGKRLHRPDGHKGSLPPVTRSILNRRFFPLAVRGPWLSRSNDQPTVAAGERARPFNRQCLC